MRRFHIRWLLSETWHLTRPAATLLQQHYLSLMIVRQLLSRCLLNPSAHMHDYVLHRLSALVASSDMDGEFDTRKGEQRNIHVFSWSLWWLMNGLSLFPPTIETDLLDQHDKDSPNQKDGPSNPDSSWCEPESPWSLNNMTLVGVLLSIYKEHLKTHTLKDYTRSPTEKDFISSYYSTNTCRA